MQFVFGSGTLFATPDLYDSGNTPVRIGAMQDISVDFAFNAKPLGASGRWSLSVGRGGGKIPCKANFAQFDSDLLSTLFLGTLSTAGSVRTAVEEPHTVASGAVTPTHAATFLRDLGIVSAAEALIYTRVASAPGALQYTCNETSGAYAFGGAEEGSAVRVSYGYTDAANGRQIDLGHTTIGHSPRFRAVLTSTFNGREMTLELPNCVAGKMDIPAKADDFTIPSFTFAAGHDDGGVVGTLNLGAGPTPAPSPAPAPPPSPDPDLVFLMHFDGDYVEERGASITPAGGNASVTATGKFDRGFRFYGEESPVGVLSYDGPALMPADATGWTIEFWTNAVPTNDDGYADGRFAYLQVDNLRFAFGNGHYMVQMPLNTYSTTDDPDGDLHHLVVQCGAYEPDGGLIRRCFWVDGVLQVKLAGGFFALDVAYVAVGAIATSTSRFSSGVVDELAVWNYPRYQADSFTPPAAPYT